MALVYGSTQNEGDPAEPRAGARACREGVPRRARGALPEVRLDVRGARARLPPLPPLRQARADRRRVARGAGAVRAPLRPPRRVLTGRPMALDSGKLGAFVQRTWDETVIPTLTEYVRIPAKSPAFDPAWREHGHVDRAVALLEGWARARPIEGLRVDVVRLEGRTPVIVVDVPGHRDETVLLYGHLDKQPEMVGWTEGSGPWTPVRRGDKLYGRGVGDDGYAVFAALTAIEALQEQRLPHARCVELIEACEESGSYDLPFYVDALADRLRTPSLVVCLDSGCGNYEQIGRASCRERG